MIFSLVIASDNTGKIVPQKTEKHITMKIKLLNKNPLSLEDIEIIFDLVFNKSNLLYTKNVQETNKKTIKLKKAGPKSDTAKECTEDMIPLLVRKVPKIQSMNVTKTNIIFQIFNIPFFS